MCSVTYCRRRKIKQNKILNDLRWWYEHLPHCSDWSDVFTLNSLGLSLRNIQVESGSMFLISWCLLLESTLGASNARNIYRWLKVSVSHVFVMQPCRVNRGITPLIRNFRTRQRWVLIFTPRPFYPLCPLSKRLDGPQRRLGRCGGETNVLPLQRIELGISWSIV